MDRLPNELLLSIFAVISRDQSDGQTSTCAVVKVCKRWYQLAIPLLWREVQLDNSNLSYLVEGSTTITRHHIRALTLKPILPRRNSRFHPYRRSAKPPSKMAPTKSFSRIWGEAIKCIRSMNRLSSFSLVVPEKEHDCGLYTRFDQSLLSQVISSLPESVRNLDITIQLPHCCDLEAQACLCATIAGIMPQLKSLRLSVWGVCPSLLSEASKVQSIVINLCWSDLGPRCLCGETSACKVINHNSEEETDNRSTFISSICQKIVAEPKKMPKLQHFVLISTYNFDSDECGPSHLLLKDDILSACTTAYPLWCVDDDVPDGEELWTLRVRDSDDPEKRDITGFMPDLETAVEQSACGEWSVPNHQIIGPDFEPSVSNGLFKASSIRERAFSHRDNGLCDLWRHEERAKFCLLAPEIVELSSTPELDLSIYGECPQIQNRELPEASTPSTS